MARTWEERTEEFEVTSDDGKQYRVQEWVGMEDVTPLGSESSKSMTTGMKRYCTSEGLACNRIDAQTFEIVARGVKLTRTGE